MWNHSPNITSVKFYKTRKSKKKIVKIGNEKIEETFDKLQNYKKKLLKNKKNELNKFYHSINFS